MTRFEAESTVHPSDFQPAGRETEGEGAADEVDVRTAVDDGVVVGPAEVVGVVEGAEDGDDEEEAGTRASFWKMLILYPPPQTVDGSPPHLDVHPSLAGIKLALDPHQHSIPYSTPA